MGLPRTGLPVCLQPPTEAHKAEHHKAPLDPEHPKAPHLLHRRELVLPSSGDEKSPVALLSSSSSSSNMALLPLLLLVALTTAPLAEGQLQLRQQPECFLPPVAGPCRAFFPMYYYDPVANVCDCFVYGGCQGNANRFDNVLQCMLTCNVAPQDQFETQKCGSLFRPEEIFTPAPAPPPPPSTTPPPPPPPSAPSTPPPPPPPPSPPPTTSRPILPPPPPPSPPPPPPPAPEDVRIQPEQDLDSPSGLTVTIQGPDGPKTIVIGQPVAISRS
ncbi:uncharacterized protein LOC143032047 [Oratosquilla oratoria]|uniref:uncharacterized protein LOC143032047 n=1 Tax=Oratosquilla oratoria TaxID=337810 RepID=UPI003F761547